MIRTAVRQEFARQIGAAGVTGDADVSHFYRGDKHETREMVFAVSDGGDVSFPYGMVPPRIQRDDFTVQWVVRIQAVPDMETAMSRRDELAGLMVDLLASADLDGFEASGEEVTDTNPGGQPINVEFSEGETKTGGQIALATLVIPMQTQTKTEG